MLFLLLPALLLALPGDTAAATAPPIALGRCPAGDYSAIVSGRFISPDSDAVMLCQAVGSTSLADARAPVHVDVYRLILVVPGPTGLAAVWQSPLLARTRGSTGLCGTAWTTGDADGNGLAECLLISRDSCLVVSFRGDTAAETRVAGPGALVQDAAVCDLDADTIPDVLTLEHSDLAGDSAARLLRAYRLTSTGLLPKSTNTLGINWGPASRVKLLGSAVFDDYPGRPVVVAGIDTSAAPRPSTYALAYQPSSDTLVLTSNPFPWSDWFTRDHVLPAGELSLFDVGDTLVGYGYFVPGARPSGPTASFAALQDGEWRLLPFTDDAYRISGPVCRFNYRGRPGWLELRDGVLYFYAGDPFRWR